MIYKKVSNVFSYSCPTIELETHTIPILDGLTQNNVKRFMVKPCERCWLFQFDLLWLFKLFLKIIFDIRLHYRQLYCYARSNPFFICKLQNLLVSKRKKNLSFDNNVACCINDLPGNNIILKGNFKINFLHFLFICIECTWKTITINRKFWIRRRGWLSLIWWPHRGCM